MVRQPPAPEELCDVYIDESSQNQHRFLVLGAIVVAKQDVDTLNSLIMAARLPDLPAGEAKWTKVSRTKLAAYERIVDVLFDNLNMVHFHSLVVDTTLLDHHRFNQGSREIGFNKEIYQLAIKCARLYGCSLFHVYPDHRETDQHPEELRLILNRGRRKDGDLRDWPFRRCQFRKSKNTLPLQLTDVLIGALAYTLNSHQHAPSPNPAKVALAGYVLQRGGVRDIFKGTARSGRFTIWPRQLQRRVL